MFVSALLQLPNTGAGGTLQPDISGHPDQEVARQRFDHDQGRGQTYERRGQRDP